MKKVALIARNQREGRITFQLTFLCVKALVLLDPKRIISRDTPRSQPFQQCNERAVNLLSTPICSSNGENTGPESASEEDEGPSVKLALREITSLLNTVVKRVERVETELKKQSESIASSSRSSSSDSSTPAKKRIVAVPLIVRVGLPTC